MSSPIVHNQGAPEEAEGYQQFISFVNSQETNPRRSISIRTWKKSLDQHVPAWHDVVARLPDISALRSINPIFPSYPEFFAAIFAYLPEHVVSQVSTPAGKREQDAVRVLVGKQRRLRRVILQILMLIVAYWVMYLILLFVNGPSTTALYHGIGIFIFTVGACLPAIWWFWRRMCHLDFITRRVQSKKIF